MSTYNTQQGERMKKAWDKGKENKKKEEIKRARAANKQKNKGKQ